MADVEDIKFEYEYDCDECGRHLTDPKDMKRIYWDSEPKSNGPFKWMETVRYKPRKLREEEAAEKQRKLEYRRAHPYDYTPVPKKQKRMVPLLKSVKPKIFGTDADDEKPEQRYFVCHACYGAIKAKATSLGCPMWA